MNELTNKTMVIVTRLGDYWVTEEQGKRIMAIKDHDSTASIEIDGNHIAVSAIDGLLTAKAYKDHSAKKRGAWLCTYGYWHERFEQCAHGQLLRRD